MVDPEPGDLDGYPDVCGFDGTDDYYAPNEVEFMHEMHGLGSPRRCPEIC